MRYKSILVCGLAAIVLTGCGGFDSTGRQTETGKSDVVSGRAVSGNAVKQEKEGTKETGKGFTIKAGNANSTNKYLSDGKEYSNVIVQYRLDGTKIRNIKVGRKGADSISVRYVNDEWLYYTRWEKKNPADATLWRAPIQKKDGCDDILFDNEEFLFLSESGIFDDIYVIGDYVYYNESGGGAKASTYCKYDMKKKDWVTFAEGSPEQSAESGAVWLGAVGENMILCCDNEVAPKGNEGIYVQPVSSNAFQKIEELGGEDEDSVQWVESYGLCEEAFFFTTSRGFTENDYEKKVVKVWRPGMEKALTYLTKEDIEKALEQSASPEITLVDSEYFTWKIWLDESHLYIHVYNEFSWNQIGVWFACDGTDEINLEVPDKVPAPFSDEDE